MSSDSAAVEDLKLPFRIHLEAGKTYLWCACGLSKRQPLCDFAHRGSGIEPLAYKASEAMTVAFCGCKKTANPPFCDGAHAR